MRDEASNFHAADVAKQTLPGGNTTCSLRGMTRTFAFGALFLLTLAGPLRGQAPAPSADEQKLAALVREIQAQQLLLQQNQTAIDERLATLEETVRQARIYASRSGK